MSSGDGFWDKFFDGGPWAPGFGVYSTSTWNQNKRNKGYNNSLNTGGNYSTTLGVNFSTVVGGNFSTRGALSMSTIVGANVPITLGGKIEMIIPWSLKWTRGLYDYDFKSCTTQKKVGFGNVLNCNMAKTTNFTLTNDEWVKKTDKTFAQQADEWVATKNLVTVERVEQVVSDQQKIVDRVEQVANSDTKNVVGAHKITATRHEIMTNQGARINMSLGITVSGVNITLSGNLLKLG